MRATQLEFEGIPVPASLARLLKRPDRLELIAAARVGFVIATHAGHRRKVTASFALEMARTFGKAHFAHDDRHALARLASGRAEIHGADIPCEAEIEARALVILREAATSMENVSRAMRKAEKGTDVY